jgi:hypothetical protein
LTLLLLVDSLLPPLRLLGMPAPASAAARAFASTAAAVSVEAEAVAVIVGAGAGVISGSASTLGIAMPTPLLLYASSPPRALALSIIRLLALSPLVSPRDSA